MDQREGRKRARGEEEEDGASSARKRSAAAVAVGGDAAGMAFQEAAAATEGGAVEAWQRPPGLFEFPWQKCRGGLGVPGGGAALELRDVFFQSLVDGRAAAIGVPGDRLFPPPSKRALFDDVDAWLAAAGDGEVDPVWRSVLEGPRPADDANVARSPGVAGPTWHPREVGSPRQQRCADVAGAREDRVILGRK